ncbi:hypothetical protein KUCAC02_031428, partial [Chaenocephalus aceratus]
ELERLSGLVGRPSESHPLHNSGLLSLDPVQDKTPLYSQLLQAYKWSNKLLQAYKWSNKLLQAYKWSNKLLQAYKWSNKLLQAYKWSNKLLQAYKWSNKLLQAYKWSNKLLQAYKWSNKVNMLTLYSQLLQAYKWSNKQSLKRSANQMGASAKRRPKVQPSTLVLPPQYVDDVISRIGRMFPDLTIELFRPNGTTIVRGFNENVYTEDGKLDIWSKSQYQVFQKVTDHATTALLHYQLPQMPDVVVRSFMTWLRSYIKLFQSPCQRCGRFLQDGLPPTWRDFRTLEAFHDTCRM